MKDTETNHQNIHIPVLMDEVLRYLDPKEGDSYLDLTAGYGGHAGKILERTLNPEWATLVDRDQNAVAHLKQKFQGQQVEIIHLDFKTAAEELKRQGRRYDMILADLGLSSPHLDNASRGFSIRLEGPLDMRMDERQSLTAEIIVNSYEEAELADIIKRYGEEPRAGKIARLIVANRPVTTTTQLADIVAHAYRPTKPVSRGPRRPGPRSKVHPATRTFQALRVAVNDELDQLERSLPIWIDLLAPGGRIGVISFHSLEDRIVKRSFADLAGDRYDATLRLLTKQPAMGSETEIVSNPRARSAKLRAAVKIKT
jgi:16S rRNA (cytosine1402-N4)-methyltransferase